uniref:ARAD1B21560p n=1 Tax=Blastobotrys adeninivorans TaxID=409370 RepID=A0A060TD47_BLAAD
MGHIHIFERQPLVDASDADLNSIPDKRSDIGVKRLLKGSLSGLKPRSSSSPNLPCAAGPLEMLSISGPPKHTNTYTPARSRPVGSRPTATTMQTIAPPKFTVLDRIVTFQEVPGTVGLTSILAQVSGGKLERIETKAPGEGNDPRVMKCYSLHLHYFDPKGAQAFFRYANAGRFVVNGRSLKPVMMHKQLASYSARKVILDQMSKGATRCLILEAHNDTNDNPRRPPAGISLDEIKLEFGKFGRVVTIQPLIRPKLAVSIQYADTSSAIRAIRAFYHHHGYKRFQGYALSFDRDPIDKECPVPLY